VAVKKIKFNKENPAHVKAIKSDNVTIHAGGYFSTDNPKKASTPLSSKAKISAPKVTKMKAPSAKKK
jgi:hypothetical protein